MTETTIVTGRTPNATDADKHSKVLVRNSITGWVAQLWNNVPPGMQWARTPDWQPRKPLWEEMLEAYQEMLADLGLAEDLGASPRCMAAELTVLANRAEDEGLSPEFVAWIIAHITVAQKDADNL